MSFATSPFGQEPPNDDPAPEQEPDPARREPLDPRLVRSFIGGAAALAVLAAGTAGFLWVSSMPSGDAADALARPTTAPSASVSPVARQSSVAFGTTDPFANNGVRSADDAPSGDGSTTGSASTGASSTGSTTSSPRTTSPGAGAATVGTSPVQVPAGTVTTNPGGGSSSAPSVSTAPGWTVPVVSFEAGFDSYGVFAVGGEVKRVLKGQLVYPLSVRYEGILPPAETTSTTSTTSSSSSTPSASATADDGKGATAVLSSENNTAVGWLVPAGSALPAPVLGKTTGAVRAYGYLGVSYDEADQQYWVRVDRGTGQLVKASAAIAGTNLVFLGRTIDSYTRAGSDAWFSDGTVTYFGQFGAGEADGVSF